MKKKFLSIIITIAMCLSTIIIPSHIAYATSNEAYQGIFMKDGIFISVTLYSGIEPGDSIGVVSHVTEPYIGNYGYVECNTYQELGEIYQNGGKYIIKSEYHDEYGYIEFKKGSICISDVIIDFYNGEYIQVSNAGANMSPDMIWLNIPERREKNIINLYISKLEEYPWHRTTYTVYDLDNDGIKELIAHGECGYDIFTYKEDKIIYLYSREHNEGPAEISNCEWCWTNDYTLLNNELKEIKVVLNGNELSFDQPPILDPEGRILVPIRGIAEAMGDDVKWNQEVKTAFVRHRDRALIIPLNEYRLLIAPSERIADWSAYELDVPSQEKNGRTLTPVRAFCESLGATVIWNQDEMTAYITYKDNYMFEDLSDEAVECINMGYSLIQNRLSFQEYTAEIYDFLESRNDKIDLAAIVWGGGIFDGFAQLFSGEEAMESAVKKSLALVVAERAEMDMEESQVVNGVKFTKSGFDVLMDLTNLPDGDVEIKNIKDLKKLSETIPELETLVTVIDDLGVYIDLTAFTIEELSYILADYSQNIKYLEDIEKYFSATAINDPLIYDAIDDMKEEYTYKWVGLFNDLRDQGTDKVMTALTDYATFGLFSVVNFAKDLSNELTGLSTSADGLYEFYGVCRFNGAFDLAYNRMIEDATDKHFRPKDFIGLFNLQKAVKIQAYKSMNKIANRVEEVSWDDRIEKVESMTYILWE